MKQPHRKRGVFSATRLLNQLKVKRMKQWDTADVWATTERFSVCRVSCTESWESIWGEIAGKLCVKGCEHLSTCCTHFLWRLVNTAFVLCGLASFHWGWRFQRVTRLSLTLCHIFFLTRSFHIVPLNLTRRVYTVMMILRHLSVQYLAVLFFHLFHFPSSFSLHSLLCGKRVIVFFLFHHRMNVRYLEMLSFAVTFLQLTLSNVLQVDDFPHIWRRIQSRSRPGFVSISRNQRDQQADICNRSSYAVKKKKKKILMWTFWSTTVWILPLRYIYLITSVTL